MKSVLAWLLKIDTEPESYSGARWSLEIQSRPEGAHAVLVVLAAIAGLVGIWWLYRQEGRSIGLVPRIALSMLRALVLAGVVLMLLEVVLVVTQPELVDSHLLLLLDNSESMSLADPYTSDGVARPTAAALGITTEEGAP